MTAKQTPQVFVADSSKQIVYLSETPFRHDLLYSPDGETYYVCVIRGFGGTSIEHDITFEDPYRGITGRFHRSGDAIMYDGERFVQRDIPFDLQTARIVPLPFARQTEYLCRTADGQLIYVGADRLNFTYESFRFYIGDGTNMREIAVRDVQRFRDGGTTYIITAEGEFFSPSPHGSSHFGNISTWGGQPLTKLDKNAFEVVETPDGRVTITKK